MSGFRPVLLVTAILSFAVPAAAQTTRPSLLLKGGGNIERSEDATEGESFAFGADLLVPLANRWTFDVEFWLPAYFTFRDELRHRDILLSVGVLRHFGGGRTRPFLSFGLGVGTTQEQRPAPFGKTSNSSGFWFIGTGADIAINPRVSIVPEVRATLAAAAFVLRPSVGVAFRF
jgi:Outer membrane protein beta-barrel domain